MKICRENYSLQLSRSEREQSGFHPPHDFDYWKAGLREKMQWHLR